ncbi:MAG: hypothetical protein ABI823_14035 [Bryobacteraceae bacterium]
MLRWPGLLACGLVCLAVGALEVRPGLWGAINAADLPLPTSGYQVYMVGELHGIAENETFAMQYLKRLHAASGLRDVAIEEDAAYEHEAQAFVDGRLEQLPSELCLRAGVLDAIRRLNATARAGIRVHLTDIDSPAEAIRSHLQVLAGRVPGMPSSAIPAASDIRGHGLEAAQKLKALVRESRDVAAIRTIEHSIRALQEGFEAGTGAGKGSPYLDDREQAVAENIIELIRIDKVPGLLVLYGDDHVSRSLRRDGGPGRNQSFAPVALRLEQAGIKAYLLVTFPLGGSSRWRGQQGALPWTAAEGHLDSGESLDKVLDSAPDVKYLYFGPGQHRAAVPSQDVARYLADGFLLFRSASPIKDYCAVP